MGAVALHPTRRRADGRGAADDRATGCQPRALSPSARPASTFTGRAGRRLRRRGDVQRAEAFAWHIDLAKRPVKPLMIQNRDADAEVPRCTRGEGAPETVIFHCFSSGPQMARTCLLMPAGCSACPARSASKMPTKFAGGGCTDPAELLLVGDRRQFTPHPFRGAPNEPYCCPTPCRPGRAAGPSGQESPRVQATIIGSAGITGSAESKKGCRDRPLCPDPWLYAMRNSASFHTARKRD